MTPLPAGRAPLRGILLKLASVVVFSVMAVLIKLVATRIPPGEIVFFRSAFAAPVIVAWLWWQGALGQGLRAVDPLGHVWRGLVGTTAMGCGFAALGFLPLPEWTIIGYAAPLFVVMFGAMFLGERVRLVRLAAVALGLVGVVVVLLPQLSVAGADANHALGAVLCLTGAVFAALAQVFIRRLTVTETTAAIVFYFSVTAAVLALATIPFGWVMPTPGEALILVAIGVIGGVAQIWLTSAYRHAEAGLVAPFDYASLLLAVAFGALFFDETPTMATVLGGALIVAAGVLIIWRERQLGLERAAERQAR